VLARRMLNRPRTMEPNHPNLAPAAPHPVGQDPVADVDRAFDEMTTGTIPRSRTADRIRRYLDDKGITPRVHQARTYLAEHRAVTAALGFTLGFALGRVLRSMRS
jgi:hypothetical protein